MSLEDLNECQLIAHDALVDHASQYDGSGFQSIILGSPAGTGKTYTAREVVNTLSKQGIRCTMLAYTGRAGGQLEKSGFTAMTCHSLLYKPILDENGDLISFQDRPMDEIQEVAGDVILVDEGSMVPKEIYERIEEIGKPIITLGDYHQLPPVSQDDDDEFNAMESVDGKRYELTQQMRFEEDSGIGLVARTLREENTIPRIKRDDLRVVPRRKASSNSFLEENQFDMILCGLNKTRKSMNHRIRDIKGFSGSEVPVVGETVVCLKNDIINNVKIYNGELFTVKQRMPSKGKHKFALVSVDNPEKTVMVTVMDTCWENEWSPNRNMGERVATFGFGYCLTVHKFQGSQADNVLFLDEDVSFFLDQRKFRYTACSRAAKNLVIAV